LNSLEASKSTASINKPFEPLLLITCAGEPAIVTLGSVNDLFTTELAPIATPSAIVMSPNIFAPGPM
jgi:hypothetical protein